MADPETQLTARQEWSRIAGEVQDDIDRVLKDLTIDVIAANKILADLHARDPEEAVKFSTSVIEYLNERWGHIGDHFLVTGEWYEPEIHADRRSQTARHVKKPAFCPVRSNGFATSDYDDVMCEAPRIGMSFIVAKDVPFKTPTQQGKFDALAFADLHEISLQYMRPNVNEAVSFELSDVIDAIERADALLNLNTVHPDALFFQLATSDQERFLRSVIDIVDSTLPAPDSSDQLLVDYLQTSLLYFKNHDRPGLKRLAAKDKHRFEVNGRVIGATVHDLIHCGPYNSYSSPEDMMANQIGISLIIEPANVNFELEGYHKRDIVVPVRLADTLSLRTGWPKS